MAKGKKSFVLYLDNRESFDDISDADAGRLIKHIFGYVSDESPKPINNTVRLLFIGIKQQLKRDLKLWDDKIEARKEAGRKGGLAKASKASNTKKDVAKLAVSVSVNGSVSVIKKEFILFWDQYHIITKKLKEDKTPAEKYWNKLTLKEKQLALENIKPMFSSLGNKKYCKKARTYLSDKSFNNEFIKVKQADDLYFIDPKGIKRLKSDFAGQTQKINEL